MPHVEGAGAGSLPIPYPGGAQTNKKLIVVVTVATSHTCAGANGPPARGQLPLIHRPCRDKGLFKRARIPESAHMCTSSPSTRAKECILVHVIVHIRVRQGSVGLHGHRSIRCTQEYCHTTTHSRPVRIAVHIVYIHTPKHIPTFECGTCNGLTRDAPTGCSDG
jgi:hypothetical protein